MSDTATCGVCGRNFADEQERDDHAGREHGTSLSDYGGEE